MRRKIKTYIFSIAFILLLLSGCGPKHMPVGNNTDNALAADDTTDTNKNDNNTDNSTDGNTTDNNAGGNNDNIEKTASPIPKAADNTQKPEKTPKPTNTPDPDTWDYVSTSGGNMIYTEPHDTPKVMPYEIRINKSMNCVTIYKRNKKGEYKKAVHSFVCSAGSKTPLGTFHTGTKYYWKAMIHDVWAQYATRITGDILFHSVPYETHKKDTLITSYYNQLGHTASAGCVRLCVRDAKWIMENCPSGTTVIVYNSPDAGPLGKPEPIKIAYNCTWDPTDPDARNPFNTKRKKSSLTGVKDRTIERGSSLNIFDGVIAIDKKKGIIPNGDIKTKGKVNTKKPGSYTINYSFKDSRGKTIKKTAVFTVADTQPPVISGITSTYYVKDISSVNADSIKKMITVTDNGETLSKKEHLTVTYKNNTANITATDDYGHKKELTVKVIEDNTIPELALNNNLKNTVPVSVNITEGYARKRIKTARDATVKLGKDDVKISIKPSGWGMRITYTLTDFAGNSASVSEKIAFEDAYIELNANDGIVVKNINNNKALAKLITVRSDVTDKKIKHTLKISHKKIKTTAELKIYKVTFKATVKSSAGSKTLTENLNVSVKK